MPIEALAIPRAIGESTRTASALGVAVGVEACSMFIPPPEGFEQFRYSDGESSSSNSSSWMAANAEGDALNENTCERDDAFLFGIKRGNVSSYYKFATEDSPASNPRHRDKDIPSVAMSNS